MEREILFRGKRLDNGEWVEGPLLSFGAGKINPRMSLILPFISWASVSLGEYTYRGFVEVDPDTVGQYTGLTDKNGKKIFEWDIVKMDSFTPPVKQISFIEGAFCLANKNGEYYADIHYIHHSMKNQATVIGNRWDNPELLEGTYGQ